MKGDDRRSLFDLRFRGIMATVLIARISALPARAWK
jgi:hypothetical protein